MAIEIIKRSDALAQGRPRYFTGKPCKHGHLSERSSSDGHCMECKRQAAVKWGAKNKNKRKESARSRRILNLDAIRDSERRRYAEDPERRKDAVRKCNLSKGGKHPIMWAQENGRLL
jgi:hypothetical protein